MMFNFPVDIPWSTCIEDNWRGTCSIFKNVVGCGYEDCKEVDPLNTISRVTFF